MREALKDPGRLEHILMAINNAMRFMEGHSEEDLKDNSILFFATVKTLEIIGEAAYMLTSEFKENHPATAWAQIVGLRHILVHGYYQVEVSELYNILHNDLQPLKEQVTAYLKEFDVPSGDN
ncbi:MAG: DUF86 domain-containing protein [Bacteroidales bacterium]|nr:DUF86 domain-containing protein [Bacteroidales bacterium]